MKRPMHPKLLTRRKVVSNLVKAFADDFVEDKREGLGGGVRELDPVRRDTLRKALTACYERAYAEGQSLPEPVPKNDRRTADSFVHVETFKGRRMQYRVSFEGLPVFGWGSTLHEAYNSLLAQINRYIHCAQAVKEAVETYDWTK